MSRPRNPRVFIVIVNWNGWQDTLACLRSLESLTYPNFDIIVVDNGSTNDSVQQFKEARPSLRLIQTGENLGFAGGNNVAIRTAMDEDAAYVWLLNNDTLVAPDALTALVNRSTSDAHPGVVGSKIYYASDPLRIWYAGGGFSRYGWTTHPGMNELDEGQFDVAGPTGYVTGCSLLASAQAIREVGLMSDDYFLYWEEVDWCARIAKAGRSVLYEPASIVWHKVSMSMGGEHSPAKARYEGRNRVLFYRRNRPARAPYVVATTLAQSLWAAILGRPRIGAAQAAGVVDGLLGRAGPIGAVR